MTFRTRLLLASVSTLAVGLASLLVLGNVLLRKQADAQTRDLLRERTSAQLAAIRVQRGRLRVQEAPNDETLDRQAWIYAGSRVLEHPSSATARTNGIAAELARQQRSAGRSVGDLELRGQPVRAPDGRIVGSVVVAISTAPVEQLEETVLLGSIAVAALVLLAGTIAVRTALSGALRPVAQMTEQAETWGAHDLDSRFDLGPPRDELTALAATLDNLLARIAASRRHEQRFAAEVAHELRTPLAGIRARAELALDPVADGAEGQRALAAITDQTARLSDTIDTLMSIARREIDPALGTVDVAAIAREFTGARVVGPARAPLAEGDPEVVRRALAPLVENAHRHARRSVELIVCAGATEVTVEVHDDGDGVARALGDRIFEPGVRGDGDAQGAGLGLPLARRLARSCGGDVRMLPGPGGRFLLTLPRIRD